MEQAAKLGGAYDFITRLPEGFNTYLERPVTDRYSAMPEGTKTLFGREVNLNGVRSAAGMKSSSNELSGGQRQRLAV